MLRIWLTNATNAKAAETPGQVRLGHEGVCIARGGKKGATIPGVTESVG